MKASHQTRDEIYLSYNYLGDGQSESGQPCPECKGGATGEKSLSVTRKGNTILFNCHRNSCGLRGSVVIGGMPAIGLKRASLDASKPYPKIMSEPLNQATIKHLSLRYDVPEDSLNFAGLGWTGDERSRYGRRISFPIYGPNGEERGKQYRSYESMSPKAISELRTEDDTLGSWYKWIRRSKVLVIVEDMMSAIKLAPSVHSLALLGTHLTDELVAEIAAAGYEHVYICLDNDATWDAIKMQLKWRHRIKGLLVAALPKDLKDMNNNEFQDWLQHTSVLQSNKPTSVLQPDHDDEIPF